MQLLFWQRQQQHEQQLGSHAVPAWPSAQIPIENLWLQCLLSSSLKCPGQFLSLRIGALVQSLGGQTAWLGSLGLTTLASGQSC